MNDDCCDMSALLTDGLDANAELLVTRAFSALWRGTAPHPADVAADVDPAEAAEVFRRLAAVGRCELDRDGRIVGAHGITRNPTRHRIAHAAGMHHTWCAFDAIGIPAALGIDATAETECPHCHAPITIHIAAGDPLDGREMVVWLPSDPGEHLIEDFCSQSNVFCSTHHLNAWRGERSAEGQIVTLVAAAEQGRRTWADVATGGDAAA